jgi:large subunit ribosomal protein L25
MDKVALKVTRRETGKKVAKDIRKSGMVPGVFYKNGLEPISITADPRSLKTLVYTAETKLIDLEIEGVAGTQGCFIKEMKFHPVTDAMVHFDLLGLTEDKKMIFEAPIVLQGTAAGVREGGLLRQTIYKMKVKCFAKDLPSSLTVDISNMNIGDSISIRDLKFDNIEFILPPDATVAQVSKSRVAKV